MYSDFFQLLQADAHPDITIRFYYDPYKLLNPGATATSISSEIWVSLAGEEKKFRLPGTVHVCYDNAACKLLVSSHVEVWKFSITTKDNTERQKEGNNSHQYNGYQK